MPLINQLNKKKYLINFAIIKYLIFSNDKL